MLWQRVTLCLTLGGILDCFPRGHAVSQSSQRWTRVPVSGHPCQFFLSACFKENYSYPNGGMDVFTVASPGPRTRSGKYQDLRKDLPKKQIIVSLTWSMRSHLMLCQTLNCGGDLEDSHLPPLCPTALWKPTPWFPWVGIALTGVSSPGVSSILGPVLRSPS